MKSFIRGILTVWITILLITFGLVNSVKEVLIDTTDKMVKKEIKTNVVKVIEESVSKDVSSDVIEKVEKEIDNNPEIKKLMDNYYDKIIEALTSDGANIEIDAKEIENIIDDSEEVLKDYDIVLTEDEKNELLSVVSSSEINDMINDAVVEVKTNMSNDMVQLLDIYVFVTSVTFKIIVLVLVVVSLVLIALLKKSFYGWLSNFAVATIISGIFVGIVLPMIISEAVSSASNGENLEFSTSLLSNFGYTLIILGVVSIVIKIAISIIKNKQHKINSEVVEDESGE